MTERHRLVEEVTAVVTVTRAAKLLGTFRFESDKPAVAEISNRGADGYVVADAAPFVPSRVSKP